MESTTYLFTLLVQGGSYSVLPALAHQRIAFPGLIVRELHSLGLARELWFIKRPLRSLLPSAQRLLEIQSDALAGQEMREGSHCGRLSGRPTWQRD